MKAGFKNSDAVALNHVGMPAIKAIVRKLGFAIQVHSNQHIIHKIVLTEIV